MKKLLTLCIMCLLFQGCAVFKGAAQAVGHVGRAVGSVADGIEKDVVSLAEGYENRTKPKK